MQQLTLTFKEPPFPDLEGHTIYHTTSEIKVAVLEHGMASGKPSVAIRIDLDEAIRVGWGTKGQVILAETSAKLFCSAVKIIMAKYPDLFND
jgi:hypothetical protein